jgi:hypothetical protein
MTVSAMEIASIFRIINEASPVFLKIGEDAAKLATRLKEITLDIDKNFGATFKAMGTGLGEQIREVGSLKRAWEEVGLAAKAASRMSGPSPHNILHGASEPAQHPARCSR